MADFDFSGRSALVTGAASGIGAACARWLDAHGIARLLLVDRDGAGLAALDLGCAVDRVEGDVTDEAMWDAIPTCDLDHAVLNAGIASGGASLASTSLDDWRRTLSVNLDGTFLALRFAMRAMAAGGAVTGGSAVVLGSLSGFKAYPGTAAYATSKAGVMQLMKVAAAEGAAGGIRVNAIAPGPVDTAIWDKSDITGSLHSGGSEARAAMMNELAKGALLRRVPGADEIARTVGFLLSDAAANITGTALLSDGGSSLRI